MQAVSITLAGWQLIVDSIPAPSQYTTLLDPAITAFDSLPTPPSSVLDSVQTKIADLVDDVQSVCIRLMLSAHCRTGVPSHL